MHDCPHQECVALVRVSRQQVPPGTNNGSHDDSPDRGGGQPQSGEAVPQIEALVLLLLTPLRKSKLTPEEQPRPADAEGGRNDARAAQVVVQLGIVHL